MAGRCCVHLSIKESTAHIAASPTSEFVILRFLAALSKSIEHELTKWDDSRGQHHSLRRVPPAGSMTALTAGLNIRTASALSCERHSQRRPQLFAALDVRLPVGEVLNSHRLSRKAWVNAAASAEPSAALPPFQVWC